MSLRDVVRPFLSHRLTVHRIWRGPLAGDKIVTSWHDYPAAILGYSEASLVRWLFNNVHEGETWIDIGAHYGYTSLAMCERVGSEGRVYAFEPNLSTVGCLDQTRLLNGYDQLTIIPLALSDKESLAVSALPTVRGMIDSQILDHASAGCQAVFSIGFDLIWEMLGAEHNARVDGIKIDVQGMEIAVLKGMRKTLELHRPKVVLEVHAGVARADILDIFRLSRYLNEPLPIETDRRTDFHDPLTNYSFLFIP
jgi:FkbM family methyltransferase